MKAAPQIFLSYAREDTRKVEHLYKKLSDAGFKPWMAQKDILPGEQWESCIRKAIRHSDFFLVCLSATSVPKRGWVQREMKQALDLWQEKLEDDIYLIPVRLEACEVPESLRRFQWVNLFEEDGWTRLVKAIQVGMERRAGPDMALPISPPPQSWRLVNWERVGAIAGVIVLIALGTWLMPKAADFLSAQLSKTPIVTPTSSPTHTPVTSIAMPTNTPFAPTSTPTFTSVPPMPTPTPVPPTDTPTPKPVAVVQAEALNVRGGPGTEYDVLGQVKQGDALEIIARTKEGDWLQVRLTSGKKGWVSMQLVEISGETMGISVATVIPPTPTPVPTPVLSPAIAEAGQVWVSPIDGAEMVYVPAGEFIMGSPQEKGHDDEHPRHTVYLDAFYIDRTEVTNAQYKRCMEAGACQAPTNCGYGDTSSDYPVMCVNWNNAQAYCAWVGKRLPTEAEWEKACRGTDGRTYPWGEGIDCDRARYVECGGLTVPAGSKPKGASPYGALDMAGNVWEWVADWYDSGYYSQLPGRNPPGPDSGEGRVLRGGSSYYNQWYARCASRWWRDPGSGDRAIGFRCARSSR